MPRHGGNGNRGDHQQHQGDEDPHNHGSQSSRAPVVEVHAVGLGLDLLGDARHAGHALDEIEIAAQEAGQRVEEDERQNQ